MAKIKAPELRTPFGWVHGGPHQLADFRGRLVLLEFWTLGCINCHHILPDIKRLQAEHADTLVVVGVHSAKFTSEQQTRNIRKAVLKFGIDYPVINDADLGLWEQYAIRAWPTVVLIDPEGNVLGQHSGEGVYKVLKPEIERAEQRFADQLVRGTWITELPTEDHGFLRFPTKLCPGPEGSFFVADSGNHRILKVSEAGKVEMALGNGKPGFQDGSLMEAEFRNPQGLAWLAPELFVADTDNHAIRSVNLATGEVTTLAGSGTMGYYWDDDRWNEPVDPNSPWDLALVGEELFIASAGNHQILRMDLSGDRKAYRWAGTGHESLHDANRQDACFNQPSGLTQAGLYLYVADTEASAIRTIHLITGQVGTLLGTGGKTAWGDADGIFDRALLQHPVGVAALGDQLFIADTYNDKVKLADLGRERTKTLAGGFDEPNDVMVMGDYIYLTNTHQHRITRIHRTNFTSEVLSLKM